MTGPDAQASGPASIASLAGAILDEEARRQPAAEEAQPVRDEDLPGVGLDTMSLAEAIRSGGWRLLALLALLNGFDELDVAASNLLAPDIQRTLGVSDSTIAVITIGGSAMLVAGGLALGMLADRMKRTKIVGLATMFWSAIVALTSLVSNAFAYFVARAFAALGRSNTQPVQGPMLADGYPIPARARVFAVHGVVGSIGALLAPLAIGGITALAGGDEGWRWAFLVAAGPTFLLGGLVMFVRDPPRGQYEQLAAIGEVVAAEHAPPLALSAAYRRIMSIRTYRTAIAAFSALGFMLVSVPLFVNLYLEDRFGLSAFERALVGSVPGLLALAVVPVAATRFDALYRTSPPKTLLLIGGLFIPVAMLVPVQMAMPTAVGFAAVGSIVGVIVAAQFAMIGPLLASVNPYYLRAQGTAIGTGMVLGIGGVGGAVIGGLLSDAVGPRLAVVIIAVPACLVGGLLLMSGSRHIDDDLALIAHEIREVQAEQRRVAQDPRDVPVLQVHGVDFSYGPVQVLFDVDLEVRRGEVVALLGTNGAGKSTLLRVVTGLGVPTRGVVRLNGHTMTLTSAETRVRHGIHHVPGGRAVFGTLTVAENFALAGIVFRGDATDRRARVDRSLEIFPELRARLDEQAGDLSGGQQQMLGLAMALMHDPAILLIDELSLGLAPVMVGQLLEVVDRLRAAGQTMVIVEQSINVALAVSDRAVFMEKGRVRFEGPTADLLGRDDLARAVFLGAPAHAANPVTPAEHDETTRDGEDAPETGAQGLPPDG